MGDEPTDDWADEAGGWDGEPAVQAYAAAAWGSLRAIVAEHGVELQGARVCDFGCGTGLLTERLVAAGARVDAVDTSPAMLLVLNDKLSTAVAPDVRTLTDLPDDGRGYDAVVCSSVCSFLPDYPATARSLVARLRPGGVFVQWDWERTGDDAHGLTRDEVRAALSAAGLVEIIVDTGFDVEVDGMRMQPLVGHGRRDQPAVT